MWWQKWALVMLDWLFYQLSDPRDKSPSLTGVPTSLYLNGSLAVDMGCTNYLCLVTWIWQCLDHWNRMGVSPTQAIWKFQKIICTIPDMELLKPLQFPEWLKCLYYSWVPWITAEFMLMRRLMVGPSSSFRIENGHQKDRPLVRRLGLWASPTSREGRGIGSWVQACGPWFNQWNSCKTLDSKAQWMFLVDELMLGRWDALILWGEITQKLCIQHPSRPCPMCLFIWLVWFESLIIKV